MIVISGLMEVAPASADAFARLSRDLVAATLLEPGCVEYRFARSLDDPDRFEIFEEFIDQDAFDAHVRAEHYRAWGRALRSEGIEITRTSVVRYDATARTVLA